jgi:hypothetical protein
MMSTCAGGRGGVDRRHARVSQKGSEKESEV